MLACVQDAVCMWATSFANVYKRLFVQLHVLKQQLMNGRQNQESDTGRFKKCFQINVHLLSPYTENKERQVAIPRTLLLSSLYSNVIFKKRPYLTLSSERAPPSGPSSHMRLCNLVMLIMCFAALK